MHAQIWASYSAVYQFGSLSQKHILDFYCNKWLVAPYHCEDKVFWHVAKERTIWNTDVQTWSGVRSIFAPTENATSYRPNVICRFFWASTDANSSLVADVDTPQWSLKLHVRDDANCKLRCDFHWNRTVPYCFSCTSLAACLVMLRITCHDENHLPKCLRPRISGVSLKRMMSSLGIFA